MQAAVIQITRIGDVRPAHPIPKRVAGYAGQEHIVDYTFDSSPAESALP